MAAENCCIFSCNLLSQRHFDGNLSHSFQTCLHLLYNMTLAPVSRISIPSSGAIMFPPASTMHLATSEPSQWCRTMTCLRPVLTWQIPEDPQAFYHGWSRSPVMSLCHTITHLSDVFAIYPAASFSSHLTIHQLWMSSQREVSCSFLLMFCCWKVLEKMGWVG